MSQSDKLHHHHRHYELKWQTTSIDWIHQKKKICMHSLHIQRIKSNEWWHHQAAACVNCMCFFVFVWITMYTWIFFKNFILFLQSYLWKQKSLWVESSLSTFTQSIRIKVRERNQFLCVWKVSDFWFFFFWF